MAFKTTMKHRRNLMIYGCLIARTCNNHQFGFFLGNILSSLNKRYCIGTGLILPG